jgi:hypothetical protein
MRPEFVALLDLAHFYKDYFLTIEVNRPGLHLDHETGLYDQIDCYWMTMTRPGQDCDWCLVVERPEPDHYFARLCECHGGSEISRFCFRDLDALAPLVPTFQT